MESFAALGTAAAIVQFIEFGGNLLADSREIFISATGASAENATLEDLAENLSNLSNKLAVSY